MDQLRDVEWQFLRCKDSKKGEVQKRVSTSYATAVPHSPEGSPEKPFHWAPCPFYFPGETGAGRGSVTQMATLRQPSLRASLLSHSAIGPLKELQKTPHWVLRHLMSPSIPPDDLLQINKHTHRDIQPRDRHLHTHTDTPTKTSTCTRAHTHRL